MPIYDANLAATLPIIWSARITHYLDTFSAFSPLAARSYQGDATLGKVVKIPTVDRSVTIKQYQRQEIAAPDQIDTSSQDLTIDQEYYFNFGIEDLDGYQDKIGASRLIDLKATGAGEGIATLIDDYCAGLFGAVTKAQFGLADDATGRDWGIDYTSELKRHAASIYMPLNRLVQIIPVEMIEYIDKNAIDKTWGDVVTAQALGNGGMTSDPVAGSTSYVGRINGIRTFATNSLQARKKADGTAPDANTRGVMSNIFVFDSRDFQFVRQVNKTEPYRIEKGFATALKGLTNYGGKITNAKRMMNFRVKDPAVASDSAKGEAQGQRGSK